MATKPSGGHQEDAAQPRDLLLSGAADPQHLPRVRRSVRDWLRAHLWPFEEAEDIVLAISEAVSNVVEHAYPTQAAGSYELRARVLLDGFNAVRQVEVTISDQGRWQSWEGNKPRPSYRGRGLAVMRGLMDTCVIRTAQAGTTVAMISGPVEMPAG